MSPKARIRKKAKPPPKPRLSREKKLLFSAVALIGFFVITEGVLTLIGVQTLAAARDPYLGFKSKLPLFEKYRDQSGQLSYRTAENKQTLFNPQTFPAHKDRNAFRIFCMGGSTTHGRPYRDKSSFVGWLRAFLQAADPDRDWQVINCGGVSYASYRVAALMEELVQYEPDLFIVLTGHNEFLERRTYSGIIEQHPVLTELHLLLYRSRIAALSESAISRVVRSPRMQAMDEYRLTGEVRPILDRSAGLDLYHRDEPLKEQILAHFRFNLGRMASLARSAGADILFIQPPVNLKDFSPFKSQHRENLTEERLDEWNRLVDQGARAMSAGKHREARHAYEQAAQIDDRYAQLHYDLGRTLFALKEFDAAKAAFRRALEEDVCPLRMLSGMNDIVADVARRHEAELIDFRGRLADRCRREHGHVIPGKEYFLDHVHPTIAVHRALGRLTLDHMIDRNLVEPDSSWNDARADAIAAQVESSLNEHDHAIARGVLAKVLRWAGKVEESDRLIDAAKEVLADDAEGCALLAGRWVRDGKLDEAIEGYRKALRLNPDLPEAYLGLARAYHAQNRFDDALQVYEEALRRRPQSASVHYGMAQTLKRTERWAEALQHLEEVTRIDSEFPALHVGLGMVMASQGRLENALAEFHEALRVDPRSTEAAAQIALIYRSQGNVKKAIEYFNRSLSVNPDSAGVHNALAITLMGVGKTAEAVQHFNSAIEADPDFPQAHFYLGVYYARQGDFSRAVQHLEQAVALEPKSPPAWHNLGLAYLRLGDFPQALRVFRRGVDTWPNDGHMTMKLAWILATAHQADLRDGAEALRLARTACDLIPQQRAACLETLAAAYAETGQFPLAVETAEQAIQLASSEARTTLASRVRFHLAHYEQHRPFRIPRGDPGGGVGRSQSVSDYSDTD